jgi:hypothetical protein
MSTIPLNPDAASQSGQNSNNASPGHQLSVSAPSGSSLVKQTEESLRRAAAIASGSSTDELLEPNILCKFCQDIMETLKPLTRQACPENLWMRLSHHNTLHDLVASATAGCHLCALFAGDKFHFDLSEHRQYRPTDPDILDLDSPPNPFFLRRQARRKPRMVPDYGYKLQIDADGRRIFLRLGVGEGTPATHSSVGSLEVRHHLSSQLALLNSRRTDATSVFQQIHHWSQTCIQQHDRCSVIRDHTFRYPRRLIEISHVNGKLLTRIKLTDGMERGVPYTCLSHCWGEIIPLKLTESNASLYYQSIPMSDLPQTFLDAIVITKRAGYHHLWIDSLCIIQDSKDDWSTQVPLMGDIYRHSTFTIAATKGADSNAGCFTDRNPLAYSYLEMRDSKSSEHRYIECPRGIIETIVGPSGYLPLLQRGWVVQERILAPRTIYYGPALVHWECVQCTASEAAPELEDRWAPGAHVPDHMRQLSKGDPLQVLILEFGLSGPKANFAKLQFLCKSRAYASWKTLWWNIIEEYTSCTLSHKSDRWPAIAGLARLVEQQSGKTLTHGLWRDHLLEELLWSTPKSSTPCLRVSNGAPSWSWLAVSGGIQFFHFNPLRSGEKTKHYAVPYLDDSTEELQRLGAIAIKAPMRKLKSRESSHYNYHWQSLYDVVEEDLLSLGLTWHGDVKPEVKEQVDAWAVQFYTFHSSRSRLLGGLVVAPLDASMKRWSRIGVYQFCFYDRKRVLAGKKVKKSFKVRTISLV